MKDFLSPLCIQPTIVSGERICLGLCVAAEDQFHVAWSESTLELAAKLLAEDIYPVLRRSFLTLERELAGTARDRPTYAASYTYTYFV